MVLEGAGSPGEVNLKAHDIVNMHMARYAGAPVLLVGDIDRGGVFASFVGTMEVLAEWERELIAGFVVNRFRGKEALLADALEYTLRHTGRPVLGVVPYIHELGLPEEDSVAFKDGAFDAQRLQRRAASKWPCWTCRTSPISPTSTRCAWNRTCASASCAQARNCARPMP